ncbi:Kinesin motor domain [Carpediemonas membranifera]|uniref:Kinesin motor domain n=1 Tax=Carpediemonas membranifera TaxID=201153 RepID=A0A8J6AXB2_9EUKA|nr:Kinesin motor domain [Carpediemonas membranifera]|eukprot:KAG9390663.1 Kinesin motor domain [Carpediemonas membranifera]
MLAQRKPKRRRKQPKATPQPVALKPFDSSPAYLSSPLESVRHPRSMERPVRRKTEELRTRFHLNLNPQLNDADALPLIPRAGASSSRSTARPSSCHADTKLKTPTISRSNTPNGLLRRVSKEPDWAKIFVAVRMRPLINAEKQDPRNHNKVFVVEEQTNALTVTPPSRTSRSRQPREFTFDKVFPPLATQEEVFQQVAYPIVAAAIRGIPGALMAYGTTGSGKCLARGTKVLMSSGQFQCAEGIQAGDMIMGAEGTPKRVLTVARGREEMARVETGDGAFTCNMSHVISFMMSGAGPTLTKDSDCRVEFVLVSRDEANEVTAVRAGSETFPDADAAEAFKTTMEQPNAVHEGLPVLHDGTILDMPVRRFLDDECMHLSLRERSFMFHAPRIERFDTPAALANSPPAVVDDVPDAPSFEWTLGAWLGAGSLGHKGVPQLTTADPDVVEGFTLAVKSVGCRLVPADEADTYNLLGADGLDSPFLTWLRANDLCSAKHVPLAIKVGSVQQRLSLLAGFIDTNGTLDSGAFVITHAQGQVEEDIKFIARSLGFPVTVGSHEDRPCAMIHATAPLPCRKVVPLPNSSGPDPVGFTVTPQPEDDYYGFTMEGPTCRFVVTESMLVTHNTYTMLGQPGTPGIVGHVIANLMSKITVSTDRAGRSTGRPPQFTVEMAFIEVYNEKIRDLLAARGPAAEDEEGRVQGPFLTLREHATKGWVLPDMKSEPVVTIDDAEQLLRRGTMCRTRSSTSLNEASSRSHAMIILRVITAETDATISLVDLAGSERASAERGKEGDGRRQQEGSHINKSLLALGTCITALALGRWAPYRDSKLTLLLQRVLSGHSMAGIITCLSPVAESIVDNVAAIQYAARATQVPTKSVTIQRQTPADKNTTMLKSTVAQLTKEVESLTGQLGERDALKAEVARLNQQISFLRKNMDEMADRLALYEQERQLQPILARQRNNGGLVSPRREKHASPEPGIGSSVGNNTVPLPKMSPRRSSITPATMTRRSSQIQITPTPRGEAAAKAVISPSTGQLQHKLDLLESIYNR